MGSTPPTFNDKFEGYMQNFLCRLLRHDFVVSYINDFFNQNERTYYSFFMLMKVLGAHTNLKFQTNYWSDCYIYFYEKLGIHGILFIPLLLSKGTTDEKKKVLKSYLNEHINKTREKLKPNSNLVINLLEFKKVILTYISCVSTRGLENVIKAMDNDIKEEEFIKKPEVIKEIKLFKLLYSNQFVEEFVDVLLRPYSRQNYYANAGKFIDDNIDFLTEDKEIRLRLRQYSLGQKEINELYKKIQKDNINPNNNIDNQTNHSENVKKSNNTNKNVKSGIGNNNIVINEKGLNSNHHEIEKKINLIGSNNNMEINTNSKNLISGDRLKDEQNDIINKSFKTGDWEVKKENSIRQIRSISTKNKDNEINNINNFSEFEESFQNEDIPKKI